MGVENTKEKSSKLLAASLLHRILVHIDNINGELSIGVVQDILRWTKLFVTCLGYPNPLPFHLSSSISK